MIRLLWNNKIHRRDLGFFNFSNWLHRELRNTEIKLLNCLRPSFKQTSSSFSLIFQFFIYDHSSSWGVRTKPNNYEARWQIKFLSFYWLALWSEFWSQDFVHFSFQLSSQLLLIKFFTSLSSGKTFRFTILSDIMNFRRTSGIGMDPSSRWKVSMMEMSIRGIAQAVPFTVCANLSPILMFSRRDW